MPNAKRPGMNKDASPAAPAVWMPNPTFQPHDNMAPFKPAPVSNATDGGEYKRTQGLEYLMEDEEGTGKY